MSNSRSQRKPNMRELAAAIARELFTNGAGEHAGRLVLEGEGGRDLGGLSEEVVVDRIERRLKGKRKPGKKAAGILRKAGA